MPESDIIKLSPQARFFAITTARAEYRQVMLRPDIQNGIALAFAEMAVRGASREQLDGAQAFISIFQNFSEPPQPTQSLPQKSLRSTLA